MDSVSKSKINWEAIVMETLYTLDTTVNVHLNKKKPYNYKNCISPSQINLVKDFEKQSWYFFDPDVLLKYGLIDRKFHKTAVKSKILDDSGYVNTTLGTLIHAALLPPICETLKKYKVPAEIEVDVKSVEFCAWGTADLVIKDDINKTISVYDLKTTSAENILTRHKDCKKSYQMQLLAYALCFLEQNPEYGIDELGVISLCKDPNPRTPCVAYCGLDMETLYKTYHTFLEGVAKHVRSINTFLKSKNEKYCDWIF